MTASEAAKVGLEYLGYLPGRVEQTISMKGRGFFRRDLWNAFDWLGVSSQGLLFVQACKIGDRAEHVRALLSNPAALLTASVAPVELWTFGLRGPAGGEKLRFIRREWLHKVDSGLFTFEDCGFISVKEAERARRERAARKQAETDAAREV